ncbi:hypothetical protein O6H91_17G061100 [Diphasiastrum complanatum]|uniref:Uncharacterized protein n=1 Tax=Diphasiastrum complanatum TaxID=34168 RepID=A0ACC2B8G7_DIPCM|nr:hypothetical protein O6H91_17G061100 [Diphasiastrum complanatum]
MGICINGTENGVGCIQKFSFHRTLPGKLQPLFQFPGKGATVLVIWKGKCSGRADRGRRRGSFSVRSAHEAPPALDKAPFNPGSASPSLQSEIDKINVLKSTNVATTTSSTKAGISKKKISLNQLIEPVTSELQTLNENLESVVGAQNPVLMSAAKQLFGAGGKRMRPAVVFLVSRATAELAGLEDIRPQHRRLAEITEMIHTASLIHDDVLDESDIRRGKKTIHQIYGTRVAVLAGDFMFAQSSWYLANLDNLEVIKLISQVIRDFASGEIKQASSLFDCGTSLQDYLDKSYYKTASLIAASTRSAAIFSGVNASICDQMFEYGMHLGLAFQIVDDILDFTQSTEQLGKPAGSDLAKGNLTAPVLFALEQEPGLRELIDSEFTDDGSLQTAISMVYNSGGLEKARRLAKAKGELALNNLQCLPNGPVRSSLTGMIAYVLERVF